MKQEDRIPFAGHIASCFISWMLIHFLLAELLAEYLGLSYQAAYGALVTFLLLWGILRGWQVAIGKDDAANWLKQRNKKRR